MGSMKLKIDLPIYFGGSIFILAALYRRDISFTSQIGFMYIQFMRVESCLLLEV